MVVIMNIYTERVNFLQKIMEDKKLDYVIVPTGDYHNSEYVGAYFKLREFISGFTGSNGTLLITKKEAFLWTDGRYFVQAEKELMGTGILLMKMQEENVPTLEEYLLNQYKDTQRIGIDKKIVTVSFINNLLNQNAGLQFVDFDAGSFIWDNRPKLPCNDIMLLPTNISGKSFPEKLIDVRHALKDKGADAVFISKLDDIMWLFNLRGSDVKCNPVSLSYAYISNEEVKLFIQEKAHSEIVKLYAADNGIMLHDYKDTFYILEQISGKKILIDAAYTSEQVFESLCRKNTLVFGVNPTTPLKAVKNHVEIDNIRKVYAKDNVAVTKFICYLKNAADIEKTNEYELAQYIDNLRKDIDEYLDLSFETICAYGENAAMMHYEATEENYSCLKKEGFLLVDSGGQYLGGTTDITRTIALGNLSYEMKKHYTLVLKGNLALANAKFMYGCTGRNLDILARNPLWQEGIDYKCGTGHGIGYILNVHEGPQNIRWRYDKTAEEAVLEEGMLITDEPGVYLQGKYGIRIENVLLCKRGVKNSDGQFMEFETLTYVPFEREAILKELLTEAEIKWIDAYHKTVYETMKNHFTTDEQKWLLAVCAPL